MPEGEGIAGSRAGDTAGSVFQRNVSVPSVDWSKGGTEHFGSFKESLGDLGKDKSLEPIKDFHGLAKVAIDGQKMIGKGIYLPDEKAKPEDRQKAVDGILKKLRDAKILEGPPETPDKYEIKFPEIEGFKPNEPLIKSFREFAHKQNIPNSQAQKMFDWYLNFQTESQAREDKEFEDLKSGLKKKWAGLSTRKFEAARRAAGKFLGEDSDELIGRMIPSDAVRIVQAFSEIGDPMLEDALIMGEKLGVSTLSDTEKKINDIVNDKKHALWDVSHPNHQRAVQEWTDLQQMFIQLQAKK